MAGPGQDHGFAREEVYPSWFANRIQDMLSAGKFDLVLSRKNATTIQVVPDAILGIAAVNIKGRWRFNTAAVERVVTGAKATYGIWAVAEDNSVNNTPSPFTDHTVYTFELRVSATEPAVGAGTAIAMKIGEVDWSGTEIERIRQNRGAVTGALLADGTFSNSTQIEWAREPNGAMVPSIIKESLAEDRLAAAITKKLNYQSAPFAADGFLTGGVAAGTRPFGTTATALETGNGTIQIPKAMVWLTKGVKYNLHAQFALGTPPAIAFSIVVQRINGVSALTYTTATAQTVLPTTNKFSSGNVIENREPAEEWEVATSGWYQVALVNTEATAASSLTGVAVTIS